MQNQHSTDSFQKFAPGGRPNEPASVDATGLYVSSTSTGSERSLPEQMPNAPTIPGYVITGIIAKGGMGVVYSAHELKFDREVAIKITLHQANAERFITEAKITARLPHPNIPPVHALGTLDNGAPWLAMKLIHGQTLAELLKGRERERLDLPRFMQIFEQICQAVGFAHSRGILHRDLKPLNVMVGEFGEVQVMDWGLAKDMTSVEPASLGSESAESAENVQHTAAGAVMGTPGYMAPEQARGEVVDQRADVFALGAILAAILTGRPAFVGANLLETVEKAGRADLAEVFAHLDACGADAELIALCKRCLSAKPEDRPANGQVVANEVAAYRASVEQRLRRAETDRARAETRAAEQAKRRRVVQWAGGLIAVVLLAGLGVSLWQMQRAITAERQTAEERDAKAKALEAETLAKQEAERNLAYARKGNELLGSVFSELDPKANYATVAEFRDVLKKNLRNAAQQLEGTAIGDPLTVAEMQHTLGRSLLGMGEAELAITVFEKARATRAARLGADHPDTLTNVGNLAGSYYHAGKLDLALPLWEETLKLSKTRLGADHPDTLSSLNNLAEGYRSAGKLDKALPLLEESLRLMKAKLGADHPRTLLIANNLAIGYRACGKPELALPLLEETLTLQRARLGEDHPDTLTSMNNLAYGYHAAGKLDQSLTLYAETMRLREAKLGADHPDTLTSMNNLAAGYWAAGKLDLALPLLEETLTLRKTKLGANHPDTLTSMNNLAAGYRAAGKLDLALPLYGETLKLLQAKLGADHPDTLTSMNNLAAGYRAAGKLDLALPLYEETLKLRKARLGADHPDTLQSRVNLGRAYCEAKQGEKATPLLQEFLAGERKRAPKDDPRFAGLLAQVSLDLLRCEQFASVEELLRECLAIREKKEPNAWTTFNTMSMLSGALLGQKKYAEAEPLLLKGYEGMKARAKTPAADADRLALQQRLAETVDRLIELYTATNQPDEAARYRSAKADWWKHQMVGDPVSLTLWGWPRF